SSIESFPLHSISNLLSRLFSRSLSSLLSHTILILPLLIECSSINNSYDIRLFSLNIIWNLTEKGLIINIGKSELIMIFREILMENCVWRAGKIQSIIRLQAFNIITAILQLGHNSNYIYQRDLILSISTDLFPLIQ